MNLLVFMMIPETWVYISCPFNDVNNCNEFHNHFFKKCGLQLTTIYLFVSLTEVD